MLALGTVHLLGRLNGIWPKLAIAGLMIAMVGSLGARVRQVADLPSWDGTSLAIAQIAGRCQGTVVHAAMHWNAYTLDLPPAGNRAVMPMAYGMMAQRYRFNLEDQQSRAIAADCPTIFWTEHVSGQNPQADEVVAQLRSEGFAIDGGECSRIGDGWLLIYRPQ